MKISHDAAQPVAYRFQYGNKRMAVATDLGTYDDYTVESLRGLDTLLLEAIMILICFRSDRIHMRSNRGYLEKKAIYPMNCQEDF